MERRSNSPGSIHGSGITGSYGKHLFNFICIWQTVSQSDFLFYLQAYKHHTIYKSQWCEDSPVLGLVSALIFIFWYSNCSVGVLICVPYRLTELNIFLGVYLRSMYPLRWSICFKYPYNFYVNSCANSSIILETLCFVLWITAVPFSKIN